jgi:hypothetical protein
LFFALALSSPSSVADADDESGHPNEQLKQAEDAHTRKEANNSTYKNNK